MMIKPYHTTNYGEMYLGDCLSVMAEMADKSVDLVLTDPPYGLNKKVHDGGWSTNPIYDSVLEWDYCISDDLLNVIINKANNAIIWGGNYYNLPPSRCWLVWSKINSVPTMADAELAWTNFDLNTKTFRGRINDYEGERMHPTQKSLSLFGWCVKNYSKEQDLILDPFAGSGTTAIACIRYNRRYILIEKEEKYCEISAKRIDIELDQTDLFREQSSNGLQPVEVNQHDFFQETEKKD